MQTAKENSLYGDRPPLKQTTSDLGLVKSDEKLKKKFV
jgi:hypothetical protein